MTRATVRQAMIVTLCALSALVVQTGEAYAKGGVRSPGNLGLGIGAGTLATGLSIKYMQGDTALQGNVGFNVGNRSQFDDWLSLGFDYLFEQPSLTGGGDIELAWNIGPGVSLAVTDDTDYWILGVSGVAGLEFLFNSIPLDFVIEYRPSIYVFDDDYRYYGWGYRRGDSNIRLDIVNFGAHLRFYF